MVAQYKILNYNSWNELKRDITKDICGKDCFPYNRYVFRGHRDENWKLSATFDRRYGNYTFDERKNIENSLLNNFKDLCVTWEGKERFADYSKEQLMSIGQHYGLPTRLLDWSFSLYVATFFAFSDTENITPNIAIWVLDTQHEVWNAGYGVSLENVKVEENDRQRYQYGIFTLNNSPSKTIEDYLETCAKDYVVDGALYKIILPNKEKRTVLNDLEMMGINSFNIYRGMEGCAKAAILREFMR